MQNKKFNAESIQNYSVNEYQDKLDNESNRYNALMAAIFIIFLATPLARTILEKFMLTHVLIQLPVLVICGFIIGKFLSESLQLYIPKVLALPLLLIALFVAMIWMLPRMLDASLVYIEYHFAKFITLPLLLGLPLAFVWKYVGAITKAFLICNLISMLVVLAWLYIEAPVRLCNYYLIEEQKTLGICLIYIAGLLSLYFGAKIFFGINSEPHQKHNVGYQSG